MTTEELLNKARKAANRVLGANGNAPTKQLTNTHLSTFALLILTVGLASGYAIGAQSSGPMQSGTGNIQVIGDNFHVGGNRTVNLLNLDSKYTNRWKCSP